MNVARQSHLLRKRLEAKYNRKLRRSQPTERGMFYTIDNDRSARDVIQYRRHRHITVH